jgi:hypothetical protein
VRRADITFFWLVAVQRTLARFRVPHSAQKG